MILTLILFILILSLLVMIHEFGHFYAAKKLGVKVEEFGFGLPPRIFGKKIGETIYSINLLPFGGFVRLLGEDFEGEQLSYEEASKDSRNFISKSPLKKTIIICAGVAMNLVLAVFLYYVFLISTGYKSFNIPVFYDYNFRFGTEERMNTVVLGISDASPAQTSGIEVGEAIIEINGVPTYSFKDVRREIAKYEGQEISILLMDVRGLNRDFRTVYATPEVLIEGDPSALGVLIGSTVTLHYSGNKLMSGPAHAYNMIAYSVYTFSNLFKVSLESKDFTPVSTGVSGPVGIYSVVGGILSESTHPVRGLIDLTALFSASLAILNILPFPALDGGRLVFIVVEKISKRRINPSVEATVHKLGMLLLLGLLILVTIRDIGRII